MSKLARAEDYPLGEHGLPHMGAVITDHRKKAGWTSQEAFAIVCGVDKQTVAYWENQKYLSEMDRRIFLCKVLTIPPKLLGLTMASVFRDDLARQYSKDTEYQSAVFEEHAYGLYEDILSFARTNPDKYGGDIVYRFSRHQRELEQMTAHASSFTRDAWKDLLSRYYQHSASIAQHHAKNDIALSYATKAIDITTSFESEDSELTGSAYYKRARLHVTQHQYPLAESDIQAALEKTKQARPSLRGSIYLLAADITARSASQDGKQRSQCRHWQDDAMKFLYKKKEAEQDTTFVVVFNLYAVHHERAKTFMRFSLFHTSDQELLTCLKNTYMRAESSLLRDATSALAAARKHVSVVHPTSVMDCTITESRLLLIGREYEESAKMAKNALEQARLAHSSQGIRDIRKIHALLHELAPHNPYVCHLGVALDLL